MSFTLRVVIAGLLGFMIGASCRWFRIPVPAPPTLLGALLILTITGGYILVDRYCPPEPNPSGEDSYSRSLDSVPSPTRSRPNSSRPDDAETGSARGE